MTTTDMLNWLYANIQIPWVILLIIPAIIIIYILLKRTFITLREERDVIEQKRKTRRMMLFTRTIIALLLLIALASPFVLTEKTIEGDPFIQLLIDNSSSMGLFEDASSPLISKLEKKMNTEVKGVGTGTISNIGDGILNNLQPHGSILLLSDGNTNTGSSMGDVALLASKLNASINLVRLNQKANDAHVVVYGPSKTMENAENTFKVVIGKAGSVGSVHLKVTLDGEVVYDQQTSQNAMEFTRRLEKGDHKIVATIDSADHFPQNNVFYKNVRVVPQPKILFYSEKTSPLETLLKQLYIVESRTALPVSLKDYYAVVINDVGADKLDPVSDVLNDYVADGNGMVVVGGENSYDNGEYQHSQFETMLPVLVGQPEQKEGDMVVTIVLDISGSTSAAFGDAKTVDVEKSLAVSAYKDLKIDTRLAVIAFNTQAYLVSEPSMVFEKLGLESTIGRLKDGGGTNIGAGLLKALNVMANLPGSKNIILVSDGKTQNRQSAIEAAKLASNSGVKVYTVGVGPTTDEQFMMDLADISNGIYFRATEESKLRILFGPVEDEQDMGGRMELVIVNKNHFITNNVEPDAAIHGFNQVSPKSAGRLLATTSTGQPLLTVWRLGLGRIAAFSTDDGSGWAGDMLSSRNSRLTVRMLNWAIGEPERKSSSYVDIDDARLDEPAEIMIKDDTPPSAEGVVFYKIDDDLYSGTVKPKEAGFQSISGTVFAVNYAREYQTSGTNQELESVVRATGGKIFDANDIEGIADHAKTKAKRTINTREFVRWPFILAAIIIFILEIFIRRIIRRR